MIQGVFRPRSHPIQDQNNVVTSTRSVYRATGYKLQATSYRLQATGYKLQATSYRLQASGYRLQATGFKRLSFSRPTPIQHHRKLCKHEHERESGLCKRNSGCASVESSLLLLAAFSQDKNREQGRNQSQSPAKEA